MLKKSAKRTCAGIMSLAMLLGTAGLFPTAKVSAASGVTINEVCPKNSTYAAPDGGMYDWVELFNSSGSPVDISGWGLTDKAETPYRFTIPSGTVLQPNQGKVFFCDGTAGETNASIAPFGLSTSGETLTLTDASGNIASQITFGDMAKDTSYGQYPDGSGEFYVMSSTPGKNNAAPEGSNAVRTPSFSAESGFYDTGFALTLDVPQGTTVYYTTDGSDPTTESEKYTGAITVKDMTSEPNKYSARTDVTAYTDILAPDEGVLKAAVVRAIAVDAQGRASSIVTKTYFIGSANVERYRNMKVISLVTDPSNLFDYEKGIYVKGKVYDQGGNGMGWGMPGMGQQQGQQGQQGGFNFNFGGDQNGAQQGNPQQGQQQGNPQQGGFNFNFGDQNGAQQGNQQQGGFNMGNFNLGGAGGPVVTSDEEEADTDETVFDSISLDSIDAPEILADGDDQQQAGGAQQGGFGGFGGFGGAGGFGGFGGQQQGDGAAAGGQEGGAGGFGGFGGAGGFGGFGGQQQGDGAAAGGQEGGAGGFGGFGGAGGAGGAGGFGGGFNMGDMAFMSQANYNQKGPEWERPANIEIFENGKSVVSQDVGIRTKGAASRAWAQKSFNIFARQDYGKSSVEYDLFDGEATKAKNNKVIDTFDGFTIRNGGNDNMAGFFRDSVAQSLVTDRAMTTQATSECILFIDGEFWGIYQLMEKYNADYFKSHYGIKKNDVCFIKNNSLEDGNDQDLSEWNNLLGNLSRVDMTLDENYQRACAELDMQSFIDYFAAQIYWANHDWPNNNTGVWRSNAVDPENPYADGKWRMVLFDTEYSSNLADKVSETGPTFNSFNQAAGGGMGGFGGFMGGGGSLSGAFSNLMKNPTFRQQFELSFMDMANYNFDTKKTTAAINYYKGFKQQILDTYKRFPSSKNIRNEQTFEQDYQLLETFYNTRYGNVTSQMKNYMNLTGSLATVNVSNDSSKGSLQLNTIKFDDSMSTWSGKYFTDFPVTAKATPKEGYSFDHWEVTGATVSDTSSDTITVPVSEGVTIKAVYKTGSSEPRPVVTTTTTTTTAPKVTTTTTTSYVKPTEFTNVTLLGDANCDGQVDLSDAVMIMQALANPNKYGVKGSDAKHMTDQGAANADVDKSSAGITANDALKIQEFLLGKGSL
ncbi:CotH kinase family protein [Ruminococcus sp.]|uniref:CotH kinase family protein n=1 Tax=Ruminococcus sp. TaxID=41978 RepID=UPI0025F7C5E2|nr:CotH kinase family protein [Ruminococcus sp.]